MFRMSRQLAMLNIDTKERVTLAVSETACRGNVDALFVLTCDPGGAAQPPVAVYVASLQFAPKDSEHEPGLCIDFFRHPRRFPGNAEGPFYTTGYRCQATDPQSPLVWSADCLACEAPECEAPDLLAPLNESYYNTYFVRQPRTPEEIDRACRALEVCCVAALRYGGKDRSIIRRLGNEPRLCDYIIEQNGSLTLTVDAAGDLLPRWRNAKRARRWWQFWK
jgi:hypothetical protein